MGRYVVAEVIGVTSEGLGEVIGYIVLDVSSTPARFVSPLMATLGEALGFVEELIDGDHGGRSASDQIPSANTTGDPEVAAVREVDQRGVPKRPKPDGYCLVTMARVPVLEIEVLYPSHAAAEEKAGEIIAARRPPRPNSFGPR